MTKQEYLLTVAMEECAEIQQAISKALRFGMDSSGTVRYSGRQDGKGRKVYEALKRVRLLAGSGPARILAR